ncbi:Uncharacterised protein [Vibrio cholerae]|nr:Uncharacterised protein [Vibrio cholerae]CSC32976.1 Uncharacterised protein [Vibrio cholerae]CSD74242.1 Uncharacterised protein [Vibrio cholerae]
METIPIFAAHLQHGINIHARAINRFSIKWTIKAKRFFTIGIITQPIVQRFFIKCLVSQRLCRWHILSRAQKFRLNLVYCAFNTGQ